MTYYKTMQNQLKSLKIIKNHQKSLMNLVAADTTLCNFKHKINQDIKKIKNRMLIFI